MKNANGQMNQKGGWQYDEGEGGYFKKGIDGKTAYILGEGRNWGGEVGDYRYKATSLRCAKETADYLLSE